VLLRALRTPLITSCLYRAPAALFAMAPARGASYAPSARHLFRGAGIINIDAIAHRAHRISNGMQA